MSAMDAHVADRLRVGVVKLASCSGCQLALFAGAAGLSARLQWLEPVGCTLLTSAVPPAAACYDLVLVEGAVASEDDRALLRALRRKTPFLVAVGACAQASGVLQGRGLQPVGEVVTTDAWIPGCPPSTRELVTLCGAVARGGLPAPVAGALCLECRARELACLLDAGHPCLGPVTRAGCDAACPARGIPCEGCRGRAEEAHEEEMCRRLVECGLDPVQARRRLRLFAEVKS